MSKNIIKTINQPVTQSFDIKVTGLTSLTLLNIYYDNVLVSNTSLEPRNGKIGDSIVTDDSGQARFIFYVKETYQDLVEKSESEFITALNEEIGEKKLVAVDAGSISSNTLPTNYKEIARCHATVTVDKIFEIVFSDVRDLASSKENAGIRTITLA